MRKAAIWISWVLSLSATKHKDKEAKRQGRVNCALNTEWRRIAGDEDEELVGLDNDRNVLFLRTRRSFCRCLSYLPGCWNKILGTHHLRYWLMFQSGVGGSRAEHHDRAGYGRRAAQNMGNRKQRVKGERFKPHPEWPTYSNTIAKSKSVVSPLSVTFWKLCQWGFWGTSG